jgi:hypothetical protein
MVLAFVPVLVVIALVGVEPHDRLVRPRVIPALLVAAPAVPRLPDRHPSLAIIKLVDGNQIVEVVVFQESELTPDFRQRPTKRSTIGCQARSAAFQAARGRTPCAVPIVLQMSDGLGNVFRNLTQILDHSDIDDPSAIGT